MRVRSWPFGSQRAKNPDNVQVRIGYRRDLLTKLSVRYSALSSLLRICCACVSVGVMTVGSTANIDEGRLTPGVRVVRVLAA